MKNVVVVLTGILILTLIGCGASNSVSLQKQGEYYKVNLLLGEKNPPVVGENQAAIQVTDLQDKPVTGAKVTVESSMPAMQGMPAMDYTAEATPAANGYKAKIRLTMNGSWNIRVNVATSSQNEDADFSVDVR